MKRLSIKNTKIKTKLFILGGISVFGLVFLGAESIITAREINEASTVISQSWLPATILSEELNTDIHQYRSTEYSHVITRDQSTMDKLEKEIKMLRGEISQFFDQYEMSYITSDEDRSLMENASSYWNRYLEYSDKILLLSRQRGKTEAIEMIMGESKTLFDEASQNFVLMAEFNREGAEEASIHGDILYAKVARLKIFSVVLISILIVLLIIYIIRGIEKPVGDIVEGTRRVSNGDLDVRLTYESEDEIGVLTDSVNQLIGRLKHMIDDEKYLFKEIGNGNFVARSTCEEAYQGDFAPILYSIAGLMSRLEVNKKEMEKKQREFKGEILSEAELAGGRELVSGAARAERKLKSSGQNGSKDGTEVKRMPARMERIQVDDRHAERIIPEEGNE